jgi:hypothetical protein
MKRRETSVWVESRHLSPSEINVHEERLQGDSTHPIASATQDRPTLTPITVPQLYHEAQCLRLQMVLSHLLSRNGAAGNSTGIQGGTSVGAQ